MKVVSLFTGCGGLDLGLHRAGHQIILQCECDQGAQQVLRKSFPGTLLVPDICSLQSLPKETELVAAGFPCIDVSRAGLRAGLQGHSTGLVRHVFRLLAQAKADHRAVPWVLLENVEALVDRCHGGAPLVSWVVQQLEQVGYRSWAHRIICSAGFGVPNRRRRIFILASMHGDARDVLLGQGVHRCMGSCLDAVGGDCWECFDPDDDPDTGSKSEAAMLRCSYALDLGNARSSAGVDVVPTFTTSNARICLLLSNGRYGALRIEDAERLQGFPAGHTSCCYPLHTPGVKQHRGPQLKESDAETRDRARFALLGNAVTVQVAQWVGDRLADPYRYKYLPTDNDMPLHKQYQPADMEDSVWQCLREVRIDHIRGVGAAAGTVRISSKGDTHWQQQQAQGRRATAAIHGGGTATDDEGEGAAARAPKTAADLALAAAAESARAAELEAAVEAAPVGSDGDDVDDTDSDEEGGRKLTAKAAAAAAVAAAGDALRAEAPTRTTRSTVQKVISHRLAAGRLSSSWPKCAWFIEGQGRWGVKNMSQVPVKARFVPLGEFIRKVGAAPDDLALVTYLQRLKEQGWNVDRTERKMLMCGVITNNAAATAAGQEPGHGLQGMLAGVINSLESNTAASSIGRLVWATLDRTTPPARTAAPASTTATAPAGAGSSAAAAAAGCPSVIAAASGQNFYWPGEEIDPFHLPRGFTLLPEHKLALTAEERKMFLPAEEARQPGTANTAAAEASLPAADEATAAADEPDQLVPVAAAADTAGDTAADDDGVTDSAPAAAAAAASTPTASVSCDRKVLLIWFHTNKFEWRFRSELLPFEHYKTHIKGEAVSLLSSNKLARPQEWRRAYREARHCATIVRRAEKLTAATQTMKGLAGPAAAAIAAANLSSDSDSSSSSGDVDDPEHHADRDHKAAMTGRAAKQALAVNIRMPRCKACEACTQSTGSSSRRCLLVRATAAAAAGHAGAQLSVLGDKCVGAEVEVWWPLDEAYYKGLITSYDSLRVRHTIHYEDGDVEIIPLWAPQQRIKLRTQPAQWVARAAQLAAEKAQNVKDMQAARLRVAGASGLPEGGSLTMMEQERAGNIQRNHAALKSFMTDTPLPSTEHTPAAQAAAAAEAEAEARLIAAGASLPLKSIAPEPHNACKQHVGDEPANKARDRLYASKKKVARRRAAAAAGAKLDQKAAVAPSQGTPTPPRARPKTTKKKTASKGATTAAVTAPAGVSAVAPGDSDATDPASDPQRIMTAADGTLPKVAAAAAAAAASAFPMTTAQQQLTGAAVRAGGVKRHHHHDAATDNTDTGTSTTPSAHKRVTRQASHAVDVTEPAVDTSA